MSLSHNSYTFGGSALHGDIIEGPFGLEIVVNKFPGIIGETHHIDETGGRDLHCAYTLSGYSTDALLAAALTAIGDKGGKLTGTLTVSGNRNKTYAQCTFLGYEKAADTFYDGSGVNLWVADIILRWRQRSR